MFDERLSHARKEVLRLVIRVYCWREVILQEKRI